MIRQVEGGPDGLPQLDPPPIGPVNPSRTYPLMACPDPRPSLIRSVLELGQLVVAELSYGREKEQGLHLVFVVEVRPLFGRLPSAERR